MTVLTLVSTVHLSCGELLYGLAPDRAIRFALATSYDSFGITCCCSTVKTAIYHPETHTTQDYYLIIGFYS